MAKKDDAELTKAIAAIESIDLDSIGNEEVQVIPTPFAVLNYGIFKRGGIPVGKMGELNGAPGACKSIALYQLMAKAQELFPGRYVVLFDTEFVFLNKDDLHWLTIHGVDISKERFKLVQENTAEETYNRLHQFSDDPNCCFIGLDSLGNMDAAQYMEGVRFERDKGKIKFDQPGVFAKVTQSAMKRMVRQLAANRITFVVVNQKRDNLSAYGTAQSPGGNCYRHNRSWVIEMSRVEDIEQRDEKIGMVVKAKVSRSKISAAGETNAKNHLSFYFIEGNLLETFELYNSAVELEIIKKGGAWIKWASQGKTWQGAERAMAALEEDDELRGILRSEVEAKRSA